MKIHLIRTRGFPQKELSEVRELLDHVPARFNRFVFYSGDIPHGAFITRPELLSSDPQSGRLTLNTFVSASQVRGQFT